MSLFVILSILAALFIVFSILAELIKIRKAFEYTAYKKEVHEVIETSYHGENDEQQEKTERQKDNEATGEIKESQKPVEKIYRKTRITVVSED